MGKTCATCRFAYPLQTLEEYRHNIKPKEYECRLRPPVPTVANGRGEFPVMGSDDWCGEHVEGNYKYWGFE